MPEIKFERHERDCEYNKERRAKGDVRSIMNDFHVIIDGDHRAILSRKAIGRGYWLTDPDGRRIRRDPKSSFTAIEISAQAGFEVCIVGLLALGLIPDAQTLEEIRAAEAAKMHQQAAEEDAARRQGRMHQAAPFMYRLLKQLRDDGPHLISAEVRRKPFWDQMTAILDVIDKGGTLDG